MNPFKNEEDRLVASFYGTIRAKSKRQFNLSIPKFLINNKKLFPNQEYFIKFYEKDSVEDKLYYLIKFFEEKPDDDPIKKKVKELIEQSKQD
ncbi:MAG: hypothetical protein EU529_02435 [Promethearchaeota archaeon]|nr:MAG: hypothetical protein EU529_02435 [Candidatus Lokiarchaeota archaeon]